MGNKLHYVSSNRDFTCEKCEFFSSNWNRFYDTKYKKCIKLNSLEYEINDGDCPLSKEEFKTANWRIGKV